MESEKLIMPNHEKCTMCEKCLDENGNFCPKNLFFKDIVKKIKTEEDGIRYKYREIANLAQKGQYNP